MALALNSVNSMRNPHQLFTLFTHPIIIVGPSYVVLVSGDVASGKASSLAGRLFPLFACKSLRRFGCDQQFCCGTATGKINTVSEQESYHMCIAELPRIITLNVAACKENLLNEELI